MNCPNCKAKLSCGCQKRTASNGVSVCSSCISLYETSLKKTPPTNAVSPKPVVTSVFYRGPGTQTK